MPICSMAVELIVLYQKDTIVKLAVRLNILWQLLSMSHKFPSQGDRHAARPHEPVWQESINEQQILDID